MRPGEDVVFPPSGLGFGMHCVFGLSLDGNVYPEHPGPALGIVDAAALGPLGLLDTLAGKLGLGYAPIMPVERLAAWLRKLEATSNTAPRFWSTSLAIAPWDCAKALLSMRDELVEAGWSTAGVGDGSPRLADLAAAEKAGQPLPIGRADLMRDVLDAIGEGRRPIDLSLIELVDAPDHLPPVWRQLLEGLARLGVELRLRPSSARVAPQTDLSRLLAYLHEGSIVDFTGDGTLVTLNASQELSSAEALADWIAADTDLGNTETASTVVVAEQGDTRLLDHALRRRGLPILGLAPPDPHRGTLAILPLTFAVSLAPPDPQAVLDLLNMPRPVVARWAARKLAAALRREPTFEGTAWRGAWDEIETRLICEVGPDEAAKRLAKWRTWFEVGVHERSRAVSISDAVAFCARVSDWAKDADAGAGDPLVLAAQAAADSLRAAVEALGRAALDVALFESMIATAVAAGSTDPSWRAEVGPLRAIPNAGSLWGPAETVVWWRFAHSSPASSTPWRGKERAALAALGVELDPAEANVRRAEADWVRVVCNAREKLILVVPRHERGVPLAAHPFAHRMAPLLAHGGNAERVRFDAGNLSSEPTAMFAGRTLDRQRWSNQQLPASRNTWVLPSSLRDQANGRVESASSLEDLVSCPLRWSLRHLAGLRDAGAFALPSNERLAGNLAHDVARRAFSVGVRPNPVTVHAQSLAEFDAALAATAVPLVRRGNAAELALARQTIPKSFARLALQLDAFGYAIEGLELWHSGLIDGIDIRSRIDLLVRSEASGRVVIDLKWTASDDARQAEIETGSAVQLATYASLLGDDVGAAYYALRSQRFFAAPPTPLAADGLDSAKDLGETWRDLVRDWTTIGGALRETGAIVALGVVGAAENTEPLASTLRAGPCRFCGYRVVCRVDVEGAPR